MRFSNHLIGLLNFATFLLSIPILGGGIWLSGRANNTDCLKFLQWPLIIIEVSIMVVSLAGFAGACYRNTFLMWVYLFVMFFIITALIGFIIFAYAVTDKGSGRPVTNRAYVEYYLGDYSGWLEEHVAKDSNWRKIASCVRDSKVCQKMGRTVNGVPQTADMFYNRKLSSVQVYYPYNNIYLKGWCGITPRTGSAVARYCPLWAWLHSHQPARFCFWELTKQLPRVVTHPGIAPASHSLNFGVLTTLKPVSSQKASRYEDARVVTHPGIAPASHSLNFGVLTTLKPVSSQKASRYEDARCAI
ncbi:hypothetical protein L3X38_044985 [Prunus dulcis]|uniref:Tetraspanin3 n=1 Tax=Prunus dulcis TaxID=3755 RepID=A0AAD4UZP4_PRUDU|nr:hypothetical protein L3X38_044985 [Prunus dulcis]